MNHKKVQIEKAIWNFLDLVRDEDELHLLDWPTCILVSWLELLGLIESENQKINGRGRNEKRCKQ